MAYESALDKPAGTLSSTSASSGRVYSSPEERKKATEIRRETGEEPSPEEIKQIESQDQISPTSTASEPARVTAADILLGRTEGREFVGVVKGKVIYGVTYGEKEKEFQPTAIKYARTPTQRIKEQRAKARKSARERKGLTSAYAIALQKQPKEYKQTSEVKEYKAEGSNVEKLSYFIGRTQSKLAYTSQYGKGQIKRTLAGYGSVVIGVAKPTLLYPAIAIRHPIKTAKGMYYAIKKPYKTGYKFGQYTKEDPGGSLGEFIGMKYGLTPVYTKARNVYVRTGSKYVPAEKVFAPKVLKGEQTFPSTRGVSDALTQFRKAKGKVIHAAPKPFKRTTTTQIGARLKKGEDPGLFVAPYGKGSPYFLRIAKSEYPGISLLPILRRPSAITLEKITVERMPRYIREAPAEVRAKWISQQTGKGKAYITKAVEMGGSELEAVIPPGETLIAKTGRNTISRIKGFKEYTIVEDHAVPLQRFRTVRGVSKGRTITSRAAAKEISKFQSYYGGGKRLPIYRTYGIKGSSSVTKAPPSSTVRPVKSSITAPPSRTPPQPASVIKTTKIPTGIILRRYTARLYRGGSREIIRRQIYRGGSREIIRRQTYTPRPTPRTPPPARYSARPITPIPQRSILPSLPRRFTSARKEKTILQVKQPKRLTPTGRAAGFEITGKTPKAAETTGLGGRPLKKVKKKLEEVFKL